jgi:hypothetical protein
MFEQPNVVLLGSASELVQGSQEKVPVGNQDSILPPTYTDGSAYQADE